MPSAASGPSSKTFEIARLLPAPRDAVWAAFTLLEQLKQWWGPVGLTMQSCTLDLRPGGLFHYGMAMPIGGTMWGRWVIRAVDAPERLEWLNAFSDPQGGLSRHPMAPTWPAEMLCTVAFEAKGDQTLLTLRSVPFEASAAEIATFEAGFASMTQGFGGTFDQLASFLARK
ncbi:SRPBCC domain-containing protein [Azorhizobium sp. AG788]|uniref:SRPBCC family protein n=1 Tax=Azorhizobium sp. AG788 TaxID=2183897 RepID=UPI003139C6BC